MDTPGANATLNTRAPPIALACTSPGKTSRSRTRDPALPAIEPIAIASESPAMGCCAHDSSTP